MEAAAAPAAEVASHLTWSRGGHRGRCSLAGRIVVLIVALVLSAGTGWAQEMISYDDVPVRSVLEDVEQRTGFHFLYRDALVAGTRLTLETRESSLLPAVLHALRTIGLELQVDSTRRQVLLTHVRHRADSSPRFVQGVVVDSDHGTALPFATVTWQEEGRLRGTAADEKGAFRVPLDREGARELRVSHVGYHPVIVHVSGQSSLAVRLQPADAFGPDVVVSASSLQTEIDSALHYLVQEGGASAFAEGGLLRALQVLPAVSLSAAASAGLNVRGSRADGFTVLLDGMPVYRHHHFFGLFDTFNEEALQTVGLFYGIQPARLAGPPGGTVAFATRPGSKRRHGASVGIGSTAGHLTVEGPLYDGGGSFLLSARRSMIDAIDWFHNRELVGIGLNVSREFAPLPAPLVEISDPALRQGASVVRFHDVHGQLTREWPRGARLSISGYGGGDYAMQDATRFANDVTTRDIAQQPVETLTETETGTASARLILPVRRASILQSFAGISWYEGLYRKDDFIYSDPTRVLLPTDTTDHFVALFENESRLLEIKLSQELEAPIGARGEVSGGYSLQRFEASYSEETILHRRPGVSQSSLQFDVFAETRYSPFARTDLQVGLRTHYFSSGDFLRFSPRMKARVAVLDAIAVGAGYSRNHQFLHRLYMEQDSGADVWVLSTAGEPPTGVDHLMAGIYATPTRFLFLQVELYRKRFANLREHVASASRRQLRLTSPILDPWLHDNTALSRGAEFLARTSIGPILWTNAFTLSSIEIANPRVNNGLPYPADWDRRHQFTSHALLSVGRGVQAHVTWSYATGAPNALWRSGTREPSRLGPYHRMDLGMRLRRQVHKVVAELEAGIYNLYDRDNPWYRAPLAVVSRGPQGRRVGLINVDVYDLGLQPSFEVKLRF